MKRVKNKKQILDYWQSYSDMMAALLLVFVLIIVVTIIHEKSNYEQKQKLIQQYQEQIDAQQEKLDAIVGVKGEIITKLNVEFADSDLDMKIDPDTGAISLDSAVLFDFNEYELSSQGKAILDEFFPKYFNVVLSEDVKPYISEIIIEGHTDEQGGYMYNLDLSQKRALEVADYCLGDGTRVITADRLEEVREIVTANGRSYYGLIRNADGSVNAEDSRRVEFKFRLKEDEMIQSISDILEEQ